MAQVVSSKARRAAAMASAMSAVVPSAVTPRDVLGGRVDVVERAVLAGAGQLSCDKEPGLTGNFGMAHGRDLTHLTSRAIVSRCILKG